MATNRDPIIRSVITAGHNAAAPGVRADSGTVLSLPAGTVINGQKLTAAREVTEAEVNTDLRDRTAQRLAEILRERGINPDAVEIITDRSAQNANLPLADAIRLANQSDTIPVEIHQNQAGISNMGISSLVGYNGNQPINQEAYDFARNLNRNLDPVMVNGIRASQLDNSSGRRNDPDGVAGAPEQNRPGVSSFAFNRQTNNRGVIFEGNVLSSASSYEHYLNNRDQMADAIARTIADDLAPRLAQKIESDPSLRERAYLPNQPGNQNQSTPAPAQPAAPAAQTAPQQQAPAAAQPPASAPYNPGSAFRVSGEVGPRTAPTTGASTNHRGRDFAAPVGTSIPAAASGRVYARGNEPNGTGWGNYVVIEHQVNGEKVYSLYAHMNRPTTLTGGQEVRQGQEVGVVGQTGVASGPHLHFEIIKDQPSPLARGHATYDPRTFNFSAPAAAATHGATQSPTPSTPASAQPQTGAAPAANAPAQAAAAAAAAATSTAAAAAAAATPTPAAGRVHPLSSYADTRDNLIGWLEGEKPLLYHDSKGIPTIGIGSNLRVADVRESVLSTMENSSGRHFSQADRAQIAAIVNGNGSEATQRTQLNAISQHALGRNFELSAAEQRQAYSAEVGKWQARVQTDYGVPANSRELAALTSLAYNNYGALIGSNTTAGKNLHTMFAANSTPEQQAAARAEVYYQIRYGSNPNNEAGVAKRRYAESEMFGLYPPNATPSQIAAANQVLESHRARINQYDGNANNQRGFNLANQERPGSATATPRTGATPAPQPATPAQPAQPATPQPSTPAPAAGAPQAVSSASFATAMGRVLPTQQGTQPHITDHYGVNRGSGKTHGGVDFNYVGGQSGINMRHPVVQAPVAGTVIFSGGQYGTVKIRDDQGNTHELLHMQSQSVKVGDRVNPGDPIGTMGGRGPDGASQYAQHVHYQMKDARGHLINPETWWNNPANLNTINAGTNRNAPAQTAAASSTPAPVEAVSIHNNLADNGNTVLNRILPDAGFSGQTEKAAGTQKAADLDKGNSIDMQKALDTNRVQITDTQAQGNYRYVVPTGGQEGNGYTENVWLVDDKGAKHDSSNSADGVAMSRLDIRSMTDTELSGLQQAIAEEQKNRQMQNNVSPPTNNDNRMEV